MKPADPRESHPFASPQSTAEKSESTESTDQRESHLRSFLKTLSWRIIATTTTVTIAYFVFGDISNALKVGGIEFFAKMLIYYLHERAWQLIPRGSVRGWTKGSSPFSEHE